MTKLILAAGAALLGLSAPAQAVDFALVSHVGDAWTYTLTYTDYDNMGFQDSGIHATISLTGLHGVTAVQGPTSTDFPYQNLNDIQLAWEGAVLDGGSAVTFTMPLERSGTGNFHDARHVFGFTLIAPGAVEGAITLATNGFYYGLYPSGTPGALDPANDRDIIKLIAGPVAAIPEPATWAMMVVGFGLVGMSMTPRRARGLAMG